MSSKQQRRSSTPAVPNSADMPDETDQPTRKTTPAQDFVFAVKLFGIAALVILAFWWLNRAV